MSNQILKLIAALMLIGSVVLIAFAYQMRKPQENTEQAIERIVSMPKTTVQVVKASRFIKLGQIIQADDLVVESADTQPADSFNSKSEVMGRRAIANITPGWAVLRSDLATGNVLAQALKENERAIAIKVDELIGVGGFIEPGDFVDVIAYIRADNQRVEEPQAIVALNSIRVLAYGATIPAPQEEKSNPGKAIENIKGKSTAILALAEDQTSLLSLLENAAVLRLALRPSDASADAEHKPYSIVLSDVFSTESKTQDTRQSSLTSNFQPKKSQGPMVEIYHGTNVEQIQYP